MHMSMGWLIFLTAMLEEATVPGLAGKDDRAVGLDRPVGFSESDDPLIRFYLREAPPLFFLALWTRDPRARLPSLGWSRWT